MKPAPTHLFLFVIVSVTICNTTTYKEVLP